MKLTKNQILFSFMGILFGSFLVPHFSFAASISFSPNSANSGLETSMIGTYDLTSLAQGDHAYLILYNASGTEISNSGSTGLGLTGSSQNWVTNLSFATNLTPGTFTIYGVTGGGGDADGRLPACNTQSNCNSAFGGALVHASTTVTITQSTSTPFPTSTYDTNCQTINGITTCDDPLKTQTGGLISFVEITILVISGFWFLTRHGKKEQS